MGSCSAPGEPINQYALVTYLPDELGAFLDQVRRDLVADCKARSHLSLLPPRALELSPQIAEAQIQKMCLTAQPFVVRIGEVAVFPMTCVVYLELESGQLDIERLHRELATHALDYNEPYPFHPHVTLAQNFDLGTVGERVEEAQARWESYRGPREFLLDRVVFVQNTDNKCWIDLRAFELQGLALTPPVAVETVLTRTF